MWAPALIFTQHPPTYTPTTRGIHTNKTRHACTPHPQSGAYEPGSANNYGYYGNPTAASYFGASYPSQV